MSKKTVIAVLNDGEIIAKELNNTNMYHDDILWQMLADANILPDSYKSLTSQDKTYKHEVSSSGREALIAASNGIMVIFVVYGEEANKSDKYAVVYIPDNISEKQFRTLNSAFEMVNHDDLCSIYYAGIVVKDLSYNQIDNDKYIPEYFDEISCDTYQELVDYLNYRNNKKHNF